MHARVEWEWRLSFVIQELDKLGQKIPLLEAT